MAIPACSSNDLLQRIHAITLCNGGRNVCVCGNNRAVDRSPDSKRDPPFVSQIQTVQKTEAVP